ncbi:phosphate ABC transporter substrate-binding protein PstS [Bifidobacterium subtile]|uniref:Phosphate-binding protein n=1 Tax=Bifidobacterium subtile TaxID=77635 RepID=A0A087EBR9_9BIFI|nr:phosphate ABC transporter substrate-binding protein PstS [Bifidobacterium subtile]KFJ05220.1 phosphate-binding transport protein of ABC transporter system [Bifidobacterium subtile]QOL36615.1 phosphate ABC transporter substrate-binding protein PstS [Bifidobacterium subtile]
MRKNALTRVLAVGCGLTVMAALAACGDNTAANTSGSSSSEGAAKLSGQFQGAGASSQQSAVEAWIASYQQKNPDAQIAYNPTGSGAGVTTFLTGATAWAGSDAALSADEVKQSASVCASGTAFDIPVYISPIAIVFNLKGVSGKDKHINLDGQTIAKIFDGKITTWNDDAIKSQNPKVDLPSTPITVVHRSDKSGTTKNFLSYVKDTAGSDWNYELGENWPNEVGQGAKGTDGVINTVSQADGTIGYADASKAGELGTAAVKVGDAYVPYSADAAAKVVDASPLDKTATEKNRVVVALDHNIKEANAYPVVLVSYDIACPAYKDAKTAQFVKSWLTYVVSDEGQKVAADSAGSAPMSDALRQKVTASINAIATK